VVNVDDVVDSDEDEDSEPNQLKKLCEFIFGESGRERVAMY